MSIKGYNSIIGGWDGFGCSFLRSKWKASTKRLLDGQRGKVQTSRGIENRQKFNFQTNLLK